MPVIEHLATDLWEKYEVIYKRQPTPVVWSAVRFLLQQAGNQPL